MNEIWKPTHLSDKYYISNKGNVRKDGKLINGHTCDRGYRRISITKNGWRKTISVHRLVAFAFIDNPKDKPWVNHINGIKDDNRVENLEWCTRGENEEHAHKIGLKSSVGEKNGNSRLSKKDVKNIKNRLRENVSIYKLAKKYNVSATCISLIKRGKRWSHVNTLED